MPSYVGRRNIDCRGCTTQLECCCKQASSTTNYCEKICNMCKAQILFQYLYLKLSFIIFIFIFIRSGTINLTVYCYFRETRRFNLSVSFCIFPHWGISGKPRQFIFRTMISIPLEVDAYNVWLFVDNIIITQFVRRSLVEPQLSVSLRQELQCEQLSSDEEIKKKFWPDCPFRLL